MVWCASVFEMHNNLVSVSVMPLGTYNIMTRISQPIKLLIEAETVF